MRIVLLSMSVFAVIFLPGTAYSQAFGDIRGSLYDSAGAVIPECKITIKNQDTNQVRNASTNSVGAYDAPDLVPGRYSVTAAKSEFQTTVRKDIVLEIGQTVRADFTMQLGQVTESVEVSGNAQLIDTSTTAVGTVIQNKNILELPLNGRDPLQLVALSPNVTVLTSAPSSAAITGLEGGARSNESIAVSGERFEFNYYTIDGVVNADVNFNSYIVRPSVEALLEFKVLTGVFPAEYGREPSQIVMATRSGTNAYHATLFEFFRNSALDAKLWNQVGKKNPFRRNDYGFTLSGPLIRNRLFFVSNFESLRDRTTQQEIGSVPPLAMRNGDMTGQPHVVYDPLTRVFGTDASGNPLALSASPFPGNMIPGSRFNAVTQKLLTYIPLPNQPTTALVNNYINQAPEPTNTDQFTQRIDFTQNSKLNWFGRYSFDNDFIGAATLFPQEAGGATTNTWQAVLGNTYILGPATVNEFRFAAIHFTNLLVGHFAYKQDVGATFGIPGLPDVGPEAWGVPSFSFTGFSGYSESDPAVTHDTVLQATDNISMTRGAHTLKFGVEIRRDRYNQSGNQRAHGSFTFDGDATDNPAAAANLSGYGLADFLIGNVEEADRTENVANAMDRSTSVYAYAQDDWKISRKLSLSVGLRYETMQPWHDKYCGFANAYVTSYGVGPNGNGLLPNAPPPVLDRPCGAGSFYAGVPFQYAAGVQTSVSTSLMGGRSLVQHDWLDFAPRLGLAWNPRGDTSLRASVGRVYAQDSGNPVYDMARNLTGTDLFIHNQQLANNYMNNPWANETASQSCGGYPGTCLVGSAMYADQYNRRTPYVDEWTVDIQQPVARDLVLEVGYIGSEGHFLQRLTNINQPVLRTGLNDARTIAQRQPWPAYGRFNYDNSIVNSNYNGFSAKLTRRLTNGLTLLAGFTWSHSLDDGSEIRSISALTLPANTYDLKAENYASSLFDQRQRFVASAVYLVPVGKGQRFLNHGGIVNGILGGWQLGTIVTIMNGLPTTVSQIGDLDSLNQNGNYPNATGISPFPAHPTPQKFWNSAAFDTTNPNLYYQIGNTGINTLLTPHTRNWDFSAVKNFRFREHHNIQFRFEAFNFSNHPNWATPSTNLLTSTFGVITSAYPMRQLQFALKYSF
jgi:Carboxypeptidase regulatory-like domain/TonB dependent receptor